jgi:hypothetical protein
MATLTPTLTLVSTDLSSNELNFSVTDSLTVTDPFIGMSNVTVTTTGADTIIVPSADARRFFFLRHTGVDGSGSTVTTDIKVEEGDENWFARVGPGEWMFLPLNCDGAQIIQLETTGGTIVAEYAYWTRS